MISSFFGYDFVLFFWLWFVGVVFIMVFVLCSICFYLCACSLVGNLVSSLVRKLFCCFLFLFACLFTRVCQKIATNSNAIFIQVFEYYNNLQQLGGSRHWPVSWKLVLLSWISVECKFCMSGWWFYMPQTACLWNVCLFR